MVEPAFWAEPSGISGDEKRLPAKQYCFDVLVHYPTHATTRGSMGDDEGAALVLGLQNLYGECCTIYCRDRAPEPQPTVVTSLQAKPRAPTNRTSLVVELNPINPSNSSTHQPINRST